MEKISIGYEAAVQRHTSKWWEGKSALEIAIAQLQIKELIIPWDVFHAAVQEAIGRTVRFRSESSEVLFTELVGK